MDQSVHKTSSLTVATLLTVAISASSCTDDSVNRSPSTASTSTSISTASAFPYPPIQFSWDAIPPLSAEQQTAAEAAVETEISIRNWIRNQNPVTPPEILAAVSYENRNNWLSIVPIPETGGKLYRAVGVNEITPDRWEVVVCRYDTPGAYSMGADGQLKLSTPEEKFIAFTSTVALTTEPDGAGKTSDSPRLLIVDNNPIMGEDARRTCEPFRPDPYIQQPPQPISPGK